MTGEGTQASPYIITSYDDLKEFSTDYSLMGSYLQLANDINCKDYGNKFVWETIQLKNRMQGGHTYFDLNGHTIKNVSIATNNYMFIDGENHNTVAHISNGTLQNIYAYTANGITNGNVDFNNVGISCDLTGVKNIAFSMYPAFHNCGIRVVSNTPCPTVIELDQSNSVTYYLNGIVEDTDFIIDLPSTQLIIVPDGRLSDVINCRFTGRVTGWLYRLVKGRYLTNIVMDVDFSECTYTGSTSASWETNKYHPLDGSATACVMSMVNIPSYEQCGGYFNVGSVIQADATQIRTGSWLRSNNFEVVNVSE
jgi:hypothetical protein